METTKLISGNGYEYTRAIPKVQILSYFNPVALENLCRQTGISFKPNAWGVIEGQPETWEQFSKIFLCYNFLTHGQNNADGNIMYLRADCNVPINAPLYYEKDGERFLGVQ